MKGRDIQVNLKKLHTKYVKPNCIRNTRKIIKKAPKSAYTYGYSPLWIIGSLSQKRESKQAVRPKVKKVSFSLRSPIKKAGKIR